jgi:tetratricopeptide (TPR) repeat protein
MRFMGVWSRIGVVAAATAAAAGGSWQGMEALDAGQSAAVAVATIAATCVVTLGGVLASRARNPADPIPPTAASHGVMQIDGNQARALEKVTSDVTATTFNQSRMRSTETGPALNQVSERNRLKRALVADRSNVILVHGRPGVGKSTLVSCALRETGLYETVRLHDLAPGDRLDAKALLDDIELGTKSGTGLRSGEDVLNRLQAAMEAPDGAPVTIVVDGAQCLLDPGTGTMISLDLDEALDVIADGWERQVKVILVVRDVPASETPSKWLGNATYVRVGRLPREFFTSYLEYLDPVGKFGIAALNRTASETLYDVLQGVPRLAALFCAVLALPKSAWSADGLALRLAQRPSADRERLLAQELVASLSDEQRHVVIALAAYATPVTIPYVSDLLAAEVAAGRVSVLLPDLAEKHVIAKSADRYYLPASEIYDALSRLSNGPARLLHNAANLLSGWRKSEDMILRPEDLDVHFAELDIRVRAKLWGSSYELINEMDSLLQQWNAAGLLLKYRRAIAGNLRSGFQEMVNYNALGSIYLSRGCFGEARQAFEDALRRTRDTTWPHGRRKIFINLAALCWHRGDTGEAEQYYRKALGMAQEHEDASDSMAARAGLADCFRRWGDYHQAIHYGRIALSAAQAEGSRWAVAIAVKLARWHSELNLQDEASRLIDLAEEATARYPALRVQCLDGRADLLLDAGDLRKAKDIALQALTEALQLHDPVTVLQARTTMAMAYLKLDDIDAARREIDRAARYRAEGRSLVVLALQALIAFRTEPDGETRQLFADLEREAVRRRERDERDFAAWDFEGLAICGTRVGRGDPIEPAVAAFQRARQQTPILPGLEARLRFWLEILQTRAAAGQMDPVLAAATRTTARQEQS